MCCIARQYPNILGIEVYNKINQSTVLYRFVSYLTQKWLIKEESLDDGTKKGDHGKAAVYNLGFLAVFLLFGCHVAQHLLSSPSEVTGFSLSVVLVEIGSFDGSHGKEDLKIRCPANGSRCAEDIRVGVSLTRQVDSSLLDNNSNNSQHADTAMLQLGPTGVLQVGLDVRPMFRCYNKMIVDWFER